MSWGFFQIRHSFFSPDDLVDGMIALLILSVIVTVALVAAKKIWEAKFQSITPSHKKWYVVANISKSFFLGCLVISSKYWYAFYQSQILDNFPIIELKCTCCVAIYTVADLVALYMVPKLPVSTILHHVTTTAATLLVFGLNLKIRGLAGIFGFAKMDYFMGLSVPFLS